MEYVKINGTEYLATISGLMSDKAWGGRASKTITLAMSYSQAAELFIDGASWSIISEWEEVETGDGGDTVVTRREEFDNSDYCVAGDIVAHRDGTVSVKMGKHTELEESQAILGILFGEEA